MSGGKGRWCVAAGVGMAGGGSALWRGRQAREMGTCFCSAAGVGKTGGGRVGRRGALVCRRRRRFRRRLLCVLGGAAGKGRVHVLLRRRRRWQDRRRACQVGRGAAVSPPASVWPAAALRVEGDGGKGTHACASAPPLALARPAADVSGGEGLWCVAAGVDMAGGGTWRRGLQVRKGQSCDWPAVGVGETGGGLVERGRAQVCCRRRFQGRRWPFGEAGCHLATAPPPASARPAAGLFGGQGRWCVAAGVYTAGGGHWEGRVAAGVAMAGGGTACWVWWVGKCGDQIAHSW